MISSTRSRWVGQGGLPQGCALVALAFVASTFFGPASAACDSKTISAVAQTRAVAGKFTEVAKMCGTPDVALEPSGNPRMVADPSNHAEHLWMYSTDDEAQPLEALSTPLPGDVIFAPLLANYGKAGEANPGAAMRAVSLVSEVRGVAQAFGIDPLLLHAIAHVESRHNPLAVSQAGAVGLMQIMPATARRFGVSQPQVELRNPRTSLQVSAAYLKTLQERFNNNLSLVLAAYNAGEGAVEKHGRRIPPYPETQGYVRDVLANYRLLQNASRAAQAAVSPTSK
jgi:soluble lytic murein transglycosylase-like protein